MARLTALLLSATLLLTGCQDATKEEDSTTADANRATVAVLEEEVSVLADSDQSALAAAAATTFFQTAPHVLVAAEDDQAAIRALAAISQQAEAPLLILGAEAEPVAAALEQLEAVKVFTASSLDDEDRQQLAAQNREIIDIRADQAPSNTGAAEAEADAGTSPDTGEVLNRAALREHFYRDFPAPDQLPELSGNRPVAQLTDQQQHHSGTVVAVQDSPSALAAAATALAARSNVVAYTGDPRTSPAVLKAAAEAEKVVGISAAKTTNQDGLASILGSALAGKQLPGGGQLVFDGKRYVALYGSPITPALGLLGEQGTAATIIRAADYASKYEALFAEDTTVPALEIIVTVASAAAGPDNNYSEEWDSVEFLPLIKAAQKAGQYVVLDFQPGRTEFVEQIKLYEDLLKYPHVGVALDPEWRIGPNERHLTRIGHVEADEVNDVVDYLADFTEKNRLPQKALVLHQFQTQMLRDRGKINLERPEVAVLIHADGQGTQAEKNATWDALRQDAPKVTWGWKNFIDEDHPMLTPEQTVKIRPLPHFVSYQ